MTAQSPRARTILERWDISPEELTELVDRSPSLRGILLGYVAEHQLLKLLLRVSSDMRNHGKADNHDRSAKADRTILFKGRQLKIECKSLQTNSIRRETDPGTGKPYWIGKAQVDASDRRKVTFPNGTKLETTCLLAGEFDILAVNCFEFEKEWRFAFARNRDLPRSSFSRYTPYQRRHLLATLVTVTWPPKPPFYADPLPVIEAVVRDRKR
ncbi:MAG: restriction endonuclease [Planctomycetota bacterium]